MAIIAAVADRKLKLPFQTHAPCPYSSWYLYPPDNK